MTSSRHDGDAWDLASSVGTTATMVAAARAIATRAEQPIINDPFAEPLVRAVGIGLLTRLASGDITASDLNSAVPGSSTLADNLDQVLIDAAAVRTKFYDDYFLDATTAGIKQVVILASGLDSRAYRLPWPTGTVIYQVDQPEVIDFKTRTLTDLGAPPTAERRAVSVDLRDDWPAALRSAGFDPAQKTAWSAEGLLGYLPPEAQDRLLDTITELSSSGSRLATESTPNPWPGRDEKTRQHLHELSRRWSTHGFDPQMSGLAYLGERNEAAPYLIKRGWTLSGSSIADLLAIHGFPPIENDDVRFGDTLFVHGMLTKTR
ncbi:class I SAM-dependent methyltransferase [Mycobacterium shigaense]|uniref:class I SAM-dependent methyltransferase n=1 Tax=Mycobacterium shigaense TaxID=722731 RepID=UPI000E5744D4|nr:class I SAM-dependent methyltransferase [Mycobacterium shigaense]